MVFLRTVINELIETTEEISKVVKNRPSIQQEQDLKDLKAVILALKWYYGVIPRFEQQYTEMINFALTQWD